MKEKYRRFSLVGRKLCKHRFNLTKTLSETSFTSDGLASVWCSIPKGDTSEKRGQALYLSNATFCRLLYLFLLAAGSLLMAAMLTPDVQHNLQSAFKGLSSSLCMIQVARWLLTWGKKSNFVAFCPHFQPKYL